MNDYDDIKYRIHLKRSTNGWIVSYHPEAGRAELPLEEFELFKRQLLNNDPWMDVHSDLIDAIVEKGEGWLPSEPDDATGRVFYETDLTNACHFNDGWGYTPVREEEDQGAAKSP
jgi:hypothetical protein